MDKRRYCLENVSGDREIDISRSKYCRNTLRLPVIELSTSETLRPLLMILFGIRSPITVDYEETCRRVGREITLGINVAGAPRCMMPREKVVSLDDFEVEKYHDVPFMASAFVPKRREALCARAEALGLQKAPALVDPSAVLPQNIRIGDGSFVNAGVVSGAVTMIGAGVLINRAASLGHHCMIGDFASLAPGVTLAGNIAVGDRAMIGVGAIILPDVRIGADAVIAGGSVVRKDVPDGAFVAGNPAKQRDFDPNQSSLNVPGGE